MSQKVGRYIKRLRCYIHNTVAVYNTARQKRKTDLKMKGNR